MMLVHKVPDPLPADAVSTGSQSAPTRSQSLAQWLEWLETIHPTSIDMGLERVAKVADKLALRPARAPLILVGGTNGKGSTVAMLSAIYTRAGYKVGAYTSPHIVDFCERIKINGQMADEQSVVDALAYVEQGRAPDTLTYFEYTTLAAMRVFDVMQCEVLLFEVGLGGRLDATNLWDADCSIVTSIALDHEQYLGSDISVIATEKAAIGRASKPFVTGAIDPPPSLAEFAAMYAFNHIDAGSLPESDLPVTAMKGRFQRRNAACAVAAVQAMQPLLCVTENIPHQALLSAALEGRFEKTQHDGVPIILDVAHNPASATALVDGWLDEYGAQRCNIVFATLDDKDIAGVINALSPVVGHWHCLALDVPRASSTAKLAALVELNVTPRENAHLSIVTEHENVEAAMQAALNYAGADDSCVLVAGSFHTIGAVKQWLAGATA